MRSIIRNIFSGRAEFEPTNPQFVANPYPTFAQLRKKAPVHQTASGAWVLLRYADVSEALTNPLLGNAPSPYATVHRKNRDRYACANVASNILPFLDSPEHDIPRRLIVQAYRNTMKSKEIDLDELAAKLLYEKRPSGKMKVIEDFATPLSFGVMCKLFDLPEKDIPQLEKWCNGFFYLFMAIPSKEVLTEVEVSLQDFRNYLKKKLDERRHSNQDDLLSALLNAESGGVKLTEDQVIDNAMLLFADGIENVDKGIGNAVHCLLSHPDQWKLLRREPQLVPQAVEECLRFESPAQYIGRIAREELTINGKTIKKDMPVLLVLGSANRDPEAFDNPNVFSIQRNPNKHLSFGRAKHSCVGGGLVKTEMVAALQTLVVHTPNMTRTSRKTFWHSRPGHRWIQELEVNF